MDGRLSKQRINELREEMRKEGIGCYIVVTDDFHASEYVGDYFKEREWLSGFTGTNGTLVVTMDSANLWTDGRYFIQAKEELNGSGISLMKDGEEGVPSISQFISGYIADCRNKVIGYDGRTINYQYGKKLRDEINTIDPGVEFRIDTDLVDRIWKERPEMSSNPVWKLDEKYAGVSCPEKLKKLRERAFEKEDDVWHSESMSEEELSKLNNDSNAKSLCDAVLVSSLDEIAWLYNLRGTDILYTPVFMAYSLVTKDEAVIYTDCRIEPDAIDYEEGKITIKPYLDIYKDIPYFEGRVYVDSDSTNETLAYSVKNPIFGYSLIALEKAKKNPVEIENEKKAHVLDGVALTKTIYWLKKKAKSGEIFEETELSVEKHLTDLRKSQEGFIDLSFASIVATGDHGAIVHYEPTENSNKEIEQGFLLIDTGAHYLYGTTDVTRTVSIGEVSPKMKEHYTRVLMGHIGVALSTFDEGTFGNVLDEIARKPLYDAGLDYLHGTGHGVGYLLSVHEGPNSIRKSIPETKENYLDYEYRGFTEGMITSNEPGLYLEGEYGIRIENLVLTVKKDTKLTYENLTLVPYDMDSIDFNLLGKNERLYLIKYTECIINSLSPYLTREERLWLEREKEKICI